jgi:periplasmic divalent cation tolerance protein
MFVADFQALVQGENAVMNDVVVALTTVPADFDATALADALVTERLAACVNILPAVVSVYAWEGAVQHDREQQLVMKTTRAQVAALWEALEKAHPYDMPEFVVLPVDDGSAAYLDWVRAIDRGR